MTKTMTKEELLKQNEALKIENEHLKNEAKRVRAELSSLLGAPEKHDDYTRETKIESYSWLKIAHTIGVLTSMSANAVILEKEYKQRQSALDEETEALNRKMRKVEIFAAKNNMNPSDFRNY